MISGRQLGQTQLNSLIRIVLAAALVFAVLTDGCGGREGEATIETATTIRSVSTQPPSTPQTRPPASTPAPASEYRWEAPAPEVIAAFEKMSSTGTELPAFIPTELPVGTTVAPYWWSIGEERTPPTAAEGRPPNPRMENGGGVPEVGLLLQAGEGWIEIRRNIRGDLGDLPHVSVGEVAGYDATAYSVLGMEVVQWSVDGRWFAVCGRGLPRSAVVRVARSMKMVAGQ